MTGSREGKGKCTYASGSIFEGWWQNDKPNGRGRYIDAHDQSVYDGDWVDGKREGRGVLTNLDGS